MVNNQSLFDLLEEAAEERKAAGKSQPSKPQNYDNYSNDLKNV